MLIIVQVLKEKCFKNHGFCSFTNIHKLVNEASNDSARVSRQDRQKNRRFPELIRLQELENSARSLTKKKNKCRYFWYEWCFES